MGFFPLNDAAWISIVVVLIILFNYTNNVQIWHKILSLNCISMLAKLCDN